MNKSWPSQDLKVLKRHYPKYGIGRNLPDLLGRSVSSIQHKVNRLGLRRVYSSKTPVLDPIASKRYGTRVYRVFLVGGRKYALVQETDLPKTRIHRWYLVKPNNVEYAYTKINGRTIYLHHLITGSKGIDHKNGSGLDNVRDNLRRATRAQNSWNRSGHGKGKYKGVYLAQDGSKTKPWFAQIQVNGKRIYLGHHQSEELAARAVNKAIRKYHGFFWTA